MHRPDPNRRRAPNHRRRTADRVQRPPPLGGIAGGLVKLRKRKDVIDKINEYIGEVHKAKPCPICGSPLFQNRALRAWFCSVSFHLFELKPVTFSRWHRVVASKWKNDFKPKRSKKAVYCKDCGKELTEKQRATGIHWCQKFHPVKVEPVRM